MKTVLTGFQKRLKSFTKLDSHQDTGKSHTEDKGKEKNRLSIRKNKSVRMNKKHRIMKSGLINTLKLPHKHEKVPSSPSISLKRTVPGKEGSFMDKLKSSHKISRVRKNTPFAEAENESRRAVSLFGTHDETSALKEKQQKIIKAFKKFKRRNKQLFKSVGIKNTQNRIDKQINCIHDLKMSLFDKRIMKNIVFKAWKMIVKNKNPIV